MTRRFWVGLVLTLPVFVLEMGGHLTGLTDRIGQQELQLDPVRLGHPRGAVGGLAVLRARLSIGGPALA